MGRIVELAPSVNFEDVMAAKGMGYRPDLRIFTAGIESDVTNNRLVHMVGSSTEKDLQGDYMSINALSSMTKAAPNLTVWLNHSYDLPDSIFGSVTRTPAIQHYDGVADLQLTVDVELDNPAAAKVKRFIDNGRRLGCSIGCMVTKYEVPDEEIEGANTFAMQPIIIHDVYVVEYSVVGIPANQRSWVENSIRGVFLRTLDPALAPAMKSLWPSVYRETVKSLDGSQRVALERTPDRPARSARLDWRAQTKTFVFSAQGKEMEVSREEVTKILAHPTTTAVDLATELKALNIEDASLEESDEKEETVVDEMFAINKDGTKGVKLNTPGEHEPYTGQHAHHHDSFGHGDVPNHVHEHFHSGENSHSHDHSHVAMGEEADSYWQGEPEKVAEMRAINKDGTEGILLKAGGGHMPYKGTHSHMHDAVGHGNNKEHDHEHTHDGDDSHGHDHAGVSTNEDARTDEQKAQDDPDNDGDNDASKGGDTDNDQGKGDAPAKGKPKKELDPFQIQFLASYNDFGRNLGLPEVTPEMLLLGEHPAVVKTIDAGTMKQYQSMHDTLSVLTGGAVCSNAGNVQEVASQAAQAEGQDVSQVMNVLNSVGERMGTFTKALEGLDGVLALKKEADETRATIGLAKKELDAIFIEVKKASATLDTLKRMPLGNPVHQSRSVTAQEGTVSHDDLLGINESQKATAQATDSLAQALALTEVRSIEYANGQIMRYRNWPAGVGGLAIAGKGVRPALTANQISFMEWADVVAYREGGEAQVPYMESQMEKSK